jgi:hypothetical protein
VERQECTGKERKKGLDFLHVIAAYTYWVLVAT